MPTLRRVFLHHPRIYLRSSKSIRFDRSRQLISRSGRTKCANIIRPDMGSSCASRRDGSLTRAVSGRGSPYAYDRDVPIIFFMVRVSVTERSRRAQGRSMSLQPTGSAAGIRPPGRIGPTSRVIRGIRKVAVPDQPGSVSSSRRLTCLCSGTWK